MPIRSGKLESEFTMTGIEKEIGKRSDNGVEVEGGDIDLWTPLETKTPYAVKQLLEDGRKVIMFAPNDTENPFNWSLVRILTTKDWISVDVLMGFFPRK